MAIIEVKVPQLSESVTEATLLQWKKKPGEAVAGPSVNDVAPRPALRCLTWSG